MKIKIDLSVLTEILNLKNKQEEDVITELKKIYKDFEFNLIDGVAEIDIDDINLMPDQVHNNLVGLCEKGSLNKALQKAQSLLTKYPHSSELNRILAQIYFQTGDIVQAENFLISALKLNPKNTYALILMGNLQHERSELESALSYWNTALKYDPDDYLSLSNIASLLAQQNHLDEAKSFFEESIKVNSKFPNALYGLALVYYNQGEMDFAFDKVVTALKCSKPKEEVYENAKQLAIEISKELTKNNLPEVESDIHQQKDDLIKKSKKKIKIELSNTIDTLAKLEVAEYKNKDYHRLLYKKKDLTVPHLMLHELYHLEFIIEARKIQNNFLFTSNQSHLDKFFKELSNFRAGLSKKGIPSENIKKLITSLFNGLNSQVFNTPIDLFIEQNIYKNHPKARPVQLLSLYKIISDGVKATTDKEVVNIMPKSIVSKSKILNLVHALWYKKFYGIDLVPEFKSNKIERNQAENLYHEYLEYSKDKEPSEEYELLKHWAEDLDLDGLFELKKENTNKSKTAEDVIDEVNSDPYGVESEEPDYIVEERRKFIESHGSDEINTAVVMYMVGALDFFNSRSKEDIKKIAFEFATLGMTGIDPSKGNYEVPSINKKMSGYQALAYYYVSWALGIPEMLSDLGMPFQEEYELAKKAL
ncbi:tetratricopeptide repeat protein [Psychroflexus tropicus]|uniref:tetratricopeptide repeat protein n=1 Tax=Psychroflexus tropicus TaxID=197345 RepID=UPI0003689FB5|nr:tetratricopeptide repeat protein [Psychroflexus tropicus]